MAKQIENAEIAAVVKELEAIKKLNILLLLKQGVKQGEIAKVLQVDQGNLSRLIPARIIKRK